MSASQISTSTETLMDMWTPDTSNATTSAITDETCVSQPAVSPSIGKRSQLDQVMPSA